MKCSKCGSIAVSRDGDWLKCLECGNIMFDVSSKADREKNVSPTLTIMQTEEKNMPFSHSVTAPSSNRKITADNNSVKNEKAKSKAREIFEFLLPIIAAVIIAMILKTFVFANAIVPSGSMLNTIQEKDRIIASRLAYINEEPQRYDIVIFYYPDATEQDVKNGMDKYVKRIIGLPGETVVIKDGIVYVTQTDGTVIKLRDDFVTNGMPTGDYGPYSVPDGCYFMMGDNRGNSLDSRFWKNKYVKRDKIIGKVKFRYYPSVQSLK